MADGLVVVDKPAGWTSHDVVAKCRGIFRQRRVGHSGTLDPDATGVLLVGLGRMTRLLRFLTALDKTYTAEVVLGVATNTLDAGGEVVARWDMGAVEPGEVRAAAARFVGEIEQVPPMVSAVQVGGKRLHDLARAGIEVERPARRVRVSRLVVEPSGEPGVYRMEVACSSGTYVRTLAADIGAALGGGAHLRNLRRTAIGSFSEHDARPLDDVGPAAVLAPAAALRDYSGLEVGAPVADRVRHGAVLDVAPFAACGPPPWAVTHAGVLLGVYEPAPGERAKPAVILAAG